MTKTLSVSDALTSGSAQTLTLEELALQALGISAAQLPPVPTLVENYIQRIAPRLEIPQTGQAVLRDFANIDVTSEKMGATLRQNPYLEHQLLRVVESIRKREDQPSIDAAIILLGMQNSRNLVLAIQALRTVTGRHPEWDANGKMAFKAADYLKFALKCEEAASVNKGNYPDLAYAAGYLFDLLILTAREITEDTKKIEAFIDLQFTHALRCAQIAAELAKEFPEFGLKKFAFSAALVHDLGKVALSILDPEVIGFYEDCAKRDIKRGMRHYIEERRFGVQHAQLSAWICRSLEVFHPIIPAIERHHHPGLLKSQKDLYQLGALVCLATNMARNLKKTDQAEDPIVLTWRGAELKDFPIKTQSLLAVVNRLN